MSDLKVTVVEHLCGLLNSLLIGLTKNRAYPCDLVANRQFINAVVVDGCHGQMYDTALRKVECLQTMRSILSSEMLTEPETTTTSRRTDLSYHFPGENLLGASIGVGFYSMGSAVHPGGRSRLLGVTDLFITIRNRLLDTFIATTVLNIERIMPGKREADCGYNQRFTKYWYVSANMGFGPSLRQVLCNIHVQRPRDPFDFGSSSQKPGTSSPARRSLRVSNDRAV